MQFASEQYAALIFIGISTVIFGAINYWCGRIDRARLRAHWKQQYEQQLSTNQLQWEAIARNRQTADAMRRQLAEMTESLTEMEAKALTEQQLERIEQAARQLDLNAQLMDAMRNTENAKTQRRLAASLRTVAAKQHKDVAA